MSDESGTLDSVAEQLALALRPLETAVADLPSFQAFMNRLGWQAQALTPEWSALATEVGEVITALDALRASRSIATALALLEKIAAVYRAVQAITSAPPGVSDPGAFLADIARRVFELLLVEYLSATRPTVATLLRAAGVITETPHAQAPGRPMHVETRFHFDELGRIVSDPGSIPGRVYGWGTDDLDFELLATHLHELALVVGLDVRLGRADPVLAAGLQAPADQTARTIATQLTFVLAELTVADEPVDVALAALELPPESGHPAGIILQPLIPPGVAEEHTLAPGWKLKVRAGSDVGRTFGILVRPDGVDVRYPFEPGTTPPKAGFGLALDHTAEAATLLLGSPGATRLEFGGTRAEIGFDSDGTDIEVTAGAEFHDLALVLQAGEADSFIQKIVGDGESRIPMSLGVEWSSRHGVSFTGSGAFEVSVHPHVQLGPVSVDEVTLSLVVPEKRPPDVRAEIGVGISGQLGPLSFFLRGIGLRAELRFTDDGNAGPFDINVGFKPPTGVGLSIDGGGFRGGGFLDLQPDKGEYSGGLDLEFQETIAVKAVGILTTRMPDGRPGFSLLLIITAEFPPIQLGFGFTLNGVGGLLGLNRTIAFEPLRAGVRDGSLESILFPRDVVANAARIISDLNRIFPPLADRFLIGPMAKIGWGATTLVHLELGILLEIPRPAFAIVGLLTVSAPADDVAVVDLKVSFAGTVDFQKRQLTFDASLFDSHLLTFTLTGDMAVRVYWGEDANFILTVGGFHPAYTPPPMGLPALQRLAIVLLEGDPDLRAECYLAITSNTVQFGAKVELRAGPSAFNVYGFLGLDVLVQVSPLHFIAEIAAMLAVRSGSSTLFSTRLELTLEGPTPWHAVGKATFEVGFVVKVPISVHFDRTFGDARTTSLPPVDVLSRIVAALSDPRSWRPVLPPGTAQRVSLRELPPGLLVLHPFGTLEVAQKVAPLGLTLSRFGSQRPEHGTVFRISEVQVGTDHQPTEPVKEQFAPAQFIELSDAQKLARRPFESFDAGVRLGDDAPVADHLVARDVMYEVIYVPEHHAAVDHRAGGALHDAFLRAAAVARSPLSAARRTPSPLATPRVAIATEQFAVATARDLTLHDPALVFETEAEAHDALERLGAGDPGLARELQVVRAHEMQAA